MGLLGRLLGVQKQAHNQSSTSKHHEELTDDEILTAHERVADNISRGAFLDEVENKIKSMNGLVSARTCVTLVVASYRETPAEVTRNVPDSTPIDNNFENNHRKGREFEDYITRRFDPKYFSVYNRTQDNGSPEDSNPDIIMRFKHKHIDQKIAIECKFRSNDDDDILHICKEHNIKNYRRFAQNHRDIPVYIVIGLGGVPDRPDRMFIIPLEELKNPSMHRMVFERYEKPSDMNFFWDNDLYELR